MNMNLKELETVAKELLQYAEKQKDVKEAEAYVSTNNLNVYRIVYHSQIPSNGLEEPKSEEDFGMSVRILFKDGKYGMGSSDSSFSKEGFKEAFEKAVESKVMDKDFHSLPEARGKAKFSNYHDKKIIETDEEKAIQKAYELLDGALDSFSKKKLNAGINITGEMDLLSSKMAVASSKGIMASDQHTNALATLTSNIETKEGAAGSSFDSNTHLSKLDCEKTGKDSMEMALRMQKPEKMPSGEYRVVLSKNTVAELFYSRFSLGVDSIEFFASPFVGRINQKIGVPEFSVSDLPNEEGFIGSRAYNDEGNTEKNLKLVENGELKTYLNNDYYYKKKKEYEKYAPLHGFRSGSHRSHGREPGIHSTNTVVKKGNYSDEELIKEVKNGIYVGRLWYTYPVNGYSSPDFTSTIRGNSYIIENGEIKCALTPNSMRVLDSFDNFMQSIIGIGKNPKPVQSWGQEETIVTPEIALSKFRLQKISTGKN